MWGITCYRKKGTANARASRGEGRDVNYTAQFYGSIEIMRIWARVDRSGRCVPGPRRTVFDRIWSDIVQLYHGFGGLVLMRTYYLFVERTSEAEKHDPTKFRASRQTPRENAHRRDEICVLCPL